MAIKMFADDRIGTNKMRYRTIGKSAHCTSMQSEHEQFCPQSEHNPIQLDQESAVAWKMNSHNPHNATMSNSNVDCQDNQFPCLKKVPKLLAEEV